MTCIVSSQVKCRIHCPSNLPSTPHVTDRNVDKHNDTTSTRALHRTPGDQLSHRIRPPTDRGTCEEKHDGTEQRWLTAPDISYCAIDRSHRRTGEKIRRADPY
jgi:hypothetical protein